MHGANITLVLLNNAAFRITFAPSKSRQQQKEGEREGGRKREEEEKKRLIIQEPVTGEFLLLAGTPSRAEQVRLSMKDYFKSAHCHIWWVCIVKVYLSNLET